MRLENEVAIVTGSTKGLGRFVAERYASEGAKVVVSGRNAEVGEVYVQVCVCARIYMCVDAKKRSERVHYTHTCITCTC